MALLQLLLGQVFRGPLLAHFAPDLPSAAVLSQLSLHPQPSEGLVAAASMLAGSCTELLLQSMLEGFCTELPLRC